MYNNFLRIDSGMFKIGLTAEEILILAKVMEFHYNTGNVFISNEALAGMCGSSIKTIDRKIKHLEELGLITRDTKAKRTGGKERKIIFNEEQYLALVNSNSKEQNAPSENSNEESRMDKMSIPEQTKCPFPNGQNDSIKDNNKRKTIKDNIQKDFVATAPKPSIVVTAPEEKEANIKTAFEMCKGAGGGFVF